MSDPKEKPDNVEPEAAPADSPVEPPLERPIWPSGMLQSEASRWEVDSEKDIKELDE